MRFLLLSMATRYASAAWWRVDLWRASDERENRLGKRTAVTAPAKKELLHLTTRKAWRAWLQKNYKSGSEVWLVFYRASTGMKRISYNDAVEEALCFGWIDSIVRSIDEERFAQRFSPRRPNSSFSQINKERLRALIAQGKVKPDVLATLPDLSKRFMVPGDIREAIKASPEAWRNFRRFPKPYQRVRVAFIDAARDRPNEFQKRLKYFIRMTEKNKQFGFGGAEKYFRATEDR
jgi:uncharacterized protein YdeI (YjbR/CyaY-like superfamily)